MGRSGKTTAAKVKTASSGGAPLIRWLFQPTRLFRLSLIAGAIALWPYVVDKLPDLTERSEYQLPVSQIRLIPEPKSPVPLNLLEQVARQAGLPEKLSLLDDSLTKDLAAAFRRHPWVARVIRVQKSFPAAIRVELEYRQPVLMAQVPGGQIPLDADGVILPTADFTAADVSHYPPLRDAGELPKLRPGQVWSDPAILAAARLAELLGEQWKTLKFEAILRPQNIDSQTDPRDVPLQIAGLGGSHIIWGRPPGSDHPGELEASQKIRRLEKYLADFGDYSQPNGPYEIDIRHWQEISRRRLSGAQVQSKPARPSKPDPRNQHQINEPKLRDARLPTDEKLH